MLPYHKAAMIEEMLKHLEQNTPGKSHEEQLADLRAVARFLLQSELDEMRVGTASVITSHRSK